MKLSEIQDDAAAFTLFREHFDAQVVARFTIEGEPVSKSRARFTRRGSKTHTYTPEKTLQAEQRVAWAFRQVATSYTPDPDATYGVMGLFFAGTRQRRDVDNMLKLILDGLNKVAWVDDDQVIEVSGRKSFGEPTDARTEVVVYRIGTVYRPTAKCEHCENDYPAFPSQKGRRFCSQACHIAWRRARSQKTCPTCGEQFQSYKVDKPSTFCSIACSAAAKRATVPCSHCGREFTKPRCHVRAANYCSDECRQTNWRERRKTAAKGTCEACGGPTSKKNYAMCRPCRLRARAS